MAARRVAEEQAVESNPFFKLISNVRKELLEEMARVAEQNRQLTVRLHALFDYLNSIGILVWHGMDQQTGKVKADVPTKSEDATLPVLNLLVDQGALPNLPQRGFDAYIEEHLATTEMIIKLHILHAKQDVPMKEVIQMAREFNNAPGRLRKISGEQIPLIKYLTENPDHLAEEELDALATEFNLRKEEEQPNVVGEIRVTSNEGSNVH